LSAKFWVNFASGEDPQQSTFHVAAAMKNTNDLDLVFGPVNN